VRDSNGEERGVCLELFDYTKKKIISLKDTNKIIDAEIKRFRAMPKKPRGGSWTHAGIRGCMRIIL
jgi:hypothetical protein